MTDKKPMKFLEAINWRPGSVVILNEKVSNGMNKCLVYVYLKLEPIYTNNSVLNRFKRSRALWFCCLFAAVIITNKQMKHKSSLFKKRESHSI